MNILHINTMDQGGAFLAAFRLHEGLLAQNVASRMLVLYQYRNLHKVYPFLPALSIWQKIKNSIRSRLFKGKTAKLLKDKPKVQFSFAESPYDITQHPLVRSADIVHLHWVANFLDYTSFFKKINKPVVWTLHDINPFMGGFHYHSYELKEYRLLDKVVMEQKKNALIAISNLHVVSPSRWLFEEAKKSAPLRNFPHYTIPYGLNIDIFKPYDQFKARQFFNLPQDKKIILFVADSIDDDRKGFKYLTEAFDQMKNDNVVLVTLGEGKMENIKIPYVNLGFLSDPVQIAMAYSIADIFVIPSIEDNFPNTVLEAIACGVPIVGFDTGGIPEMVKDKENGLLAQLKDSKDLGEKIKMILTDDDLRQKMSKAARTIAVNEYTLEIQTNHYQTFYRNLISKQRSD